MLNVYVMCFANKLIDFGIIKHLSFFPVHYVTKMYATSSKNSDILQLGILSMILNISLTLPLLWNSRLNGVHRHAHPLTESVDHRPRESDKIDESWVLYLY